MKRSSSDYDNRQEYRRVSRPGLPCWRTEHLETELFVCADMLLEQTAKDAVIRLRREMDAYIMRHPAFAESLEPVSALPGAPDTVCRMCEAAAAAGVGPMAAVAGAFAEYTGRALLQRSAQVIVENGGDVFMKMNDIATAAIYAGQSPLNMKIGIEVDARQQPVAVCTSSGTVGPSKSFGCADAAVVLCENACLADACATRLGNEIQGPGDIEAALQLILRIPGVIGAAAVAGEAMGAMGAMRLKSL